MSTCTQVNDSECNLLELAPVTGYTVRGYAVFDGPALTGRITFVSAISAVSNYEIRIRSTPVPCWAIAAHYHHHILFATMPANQYCIADVSIHR